MKTFRYLVVSIAAISCLPVTYGQVTLNPTATRALGAARLEQPGTLTNLQPNLVEGRELNSPQGIALDLTSVPPHLYVADTLNNRVLGWKDARGFTNGAFADLVIGQVDFFTTLQQGPFAGSSRPSSGLTAPMGMAVDANGSLYVIDAGNNRILRFPKPFNQSGDQFPDMVIGQTNFITRTPNTNGISASTLAFTSSSGINQAYLKFDAFGNLWVADPGNNRVLRYPASVLTAGANGPNADLVLGQPDFSTGSALQAFDPTSTSILRAPTGIAFDKDGGRLYVSESQGATTMGSARSRILVFTPPFSTFQPAQRIIGVVAANNPVQPPPISELQIGSQASDLFTITDNRVAIADTSNNRIMIFSPFTQFTSDTLTQKAILCLGQADCTSGKANRNNPDANSNTLQGPTDAAWQPANPSTTPPTPAELYIADAGNNRVIVMPLTPNSSDFGFDSATRELGQQQFSETAPNYVEGREFHFSDSSGRGDAGIVYDNNDGSGVPHLYVADTYNNRILCFYDARTIKTGGAADFVIGQSDLTRTVVNYPSGMADIPTQQGLNQPTGLAVDTQGNLYVADRGNSRVLRFPAPFLQPSKFAQSADLVLGQSSFVSRVVDVSASRMASPVGIAIAPGVGLLVSDQFDNRVLFFPGTNFTSGMSATKVWGQSNFNNGVSGNTDNRFSSPHGVAVDSGYRLYVADTGNNRVQIFDDIRQAGMDPHAIFSLAAIVTGSTSSSSGSGSAISGPRAIAIDGADEIWIGDNSRAFRFSGGYNSIFTSGTAGVGFTPDLVLGEAGVLALSVGTTRIDAKTTINDSLYVADFANRVVVHYTGIVPLNAASSSMIRQTVSPNDIVSLYSQGGQFTGTQSFTTLPLPTTMQSLQVLLNGAPVPLYYVSPTQINALIPNNAPTNGTADLQVLRTDNGQTLGDTTITMGSVSPGLFTTNGGGTGQVAGINDDNTANGPTNAVARGHVVSVYGTGIGNIPGAPNDGSAVSSATPSPCQGSSSFATIAGVQCSLDYIGLAPGLVGVFQANVRVSDSVVPTTSRPDRTSEIVVFVCGTPTQSQATTGRAAVTVWVK